MPPRSVCLNVFTTSLGNGKEAGVSVREVEDRMEVDAKGDSIGERGRHDSVQGSPNDSIATTPSYIESTHKTEAETPANSSPIATTDFDTTSLQEDMDCFNPRPRSGPQPTALTCETCSQPPAEGTSLQRCSRCKRAYYCSKACQKHAWKSHKLECERPSSAINTPDISHPASPISTSVPLPWSGKSSVPSATNLPSPDIAGFARRYPQPTDAWRSRNPQGRQVEITFGTTSKEVLRVHLADAYRLWRDEHGGPPATDINVVGEWKDYIDAIRERVRTPFPLDEWTKECMMNDTVAEVLGVQFSELVSRDGLLKVYQEKIVKEFDEVNEAVYGVFTEEV